MFKEDDPTLRVGKEAAASRRRSVRSLLFVVLALVLASGVSMAALADDANARKKKKKITPQPVHLASTVAQSGFNGVLLQVPPIGRTVLNGPPFTYDANQQFVTITEVRFTLTCDGCSTAPGSVEAGENTLNLGLDGIDTGLKLNGFPGERRATLTFSGTPNNASQIVAHLQDHALNASAIKIGGPNNGLTIPDDSNTTLELIGTAQQTKKRRR